MSAQPVNWFRSLTLAAAAAVCVLALGAALSSTALAPAEASAACSTTAHAENPKTTDEARWIEGNGTAMDCGALTKVCVTLVWGHAVPLYGWTRERHAETCVESPGTSEWVIRSGREKCFPGIYYTEVRGYKGDEVVIDDLSEQVNAGCNKENW